MSRIRHATEEFVNNLIGKLSNEKAPKNNAEFTGTMTLNGHNIATTDKTEILLLNGYKVVDSGRDELVASRSGNICNITGRIMNSTTIPNKLVVGVLDMQYRPKKYRRAYVYYEPTSKVAPCEVKPNGEMVIYDNTLAINSAIRFNITYCID